MNILIQNGRVLDPANNVDTTCDVLVVAGKVAQVGENLTAEGATVIDATGCWVTPGLIDMHVHLRSPGQHHKETIATGTASAALGGFTSIVPMANTSPVVDNEVVVEFINSRAAKEGYVNVFQVGAITKGMQGQELADIATMKAAGIVAVSDDGLPVANPNMLKTAMLYAKQFDLPLLMHSEDHALSAGGVINAGPHADMMGLKGISADSEEVAVARDIILAKHTGARLHIQHVSVKESLGHIRAAKAMGLPVTTEVCPHHFTLIDEDIKTYDANFKMSPPLRSASDREALIEALRDGTIDAIATDHAPHHADEKNCEFDLAMNGIVGLETAVPLSISELVNTGVLTPLELIAKLSSAPARILGLDRGTLGAGVVADITIIDPTVQWTIDKDKMATKSKNTPFHGRAVTGRCRDLIVGGRVVVQNGELC